MDPNSIKNPSKIEPKSIKNPPKIDLGGVLGASWGLLGASWRRLGGALGPLGGLLVSWSRPGRVLGASWWARRLPKRSPHASKIEAKINQFLNASWNQIFEGFWWILESKMEASWHPDGIKNRSQLRKANYSETFVFLRENQYFEGSGG